MSIIKRILSTFVGRKNNKSGGDAKDDVPTPSSDSKSFEDKFTVVQPPKYRGICICGCNGKKYNYSRSSHVDLNRYKQCPARLARKKNEALRSAYKLEKKKKHSWRERDSVGANAKSAQEAVFRGLKTYAGTACPTCKTTTKTKHGFCKKCKVSENKIRDAMRRGAYPEDLTSDERIQIIKIYDEAKKISLETGIAHHVDHIKPLAKGGRHHPSNLQIITAEENLKKGSKWE